MTSTLSQYKNILYFKHEFSSTKVNVVEKCFSEEINILCKRLFRPKKNDEGCWLLLQKGGKSVAKFPEERCLVLQDAQ